MDLIRSIVQRVAACDDPYGLEYMPEIAGYTKGQVSYHLKIMHEAGLIDALIPDDAFETEYTDFRQINLTWKGQDFLDAAKDNSVWKKTKDKVLDVRTEI